MKKVLYFLLIIISVICITACAAESDNSSATTTADVTTELSTEPSVPESSTPQYQLDLLMESDLAACQTNHEISETYRNYAGKWEALMTEYYQAIQESGVSFRQIDLAEIVKAEQESWETYAETKSEFISGYYALYFQGGTAGGTATAQRVCELYKERALELYKYCTDFNIECTAP